MLTQNEVRCYEKAKAKKAKSLFGGVFSKTAKKIKAPALTTVAVGWVRSADRFRRPKAIRGL